MAEDRTPINAVRYSGKDFPSLFDEILRRLKVLYGDVYNDYESSSLGIMLVDLMAYAVSQLAWYQDRMLSEVYLDTAKTRDAVSRIVQQIGYKMRPASAAVADLTATFQSGAIKQAGVIPTGFKFSSINGIIYEARADVLLNTTDLIYTVPVRQGETKRLAFTSSGEANQVFQLPNPSEGEWIADSSVRVWVDGQEWEERDFLEFEKTNHFEVHYHNEPPEVQFGDGFAGNIPPEGADIRIQFVVIKGKGGEVGSNSITRVVDTLIIGGETVSFEVTNAVASNGGADPESIDEAKKNAPNSFAARGAAITKRDYIALVNAFTNSEYGSVAKAYPLVLRKAENDAVLQKILTDIASIVNTYSGDVASLEDTLVSVFSSLTSYLATMNTWVNELDTRIDDVVSQHDIIRSTEQSSKNLASQISGLSSTIANISSDLRAQVGLISGNSNERDEMYRLLDLLDAYNTGTNGVSQLASGIMSNMNTIDNSLDTLNGLVTDNDDSIDKAQFNLASTYTGMSSQVSSGSSAISNLDGKASDMADDVNDALPKISTRFTEVFDGDCRANVVQVPILSNDVDGNYVAPASGLINAVQEYLDEISEVTQAVEVVDGSFLLVAIDMNIEVHVLDGYVSSEVLSAVENAVYGLLKGRDFNDPLYVHDVHNTIHAASSGIDYANVEITGPSSYLDNDGNVTVGIENKVIVAGSISIVEV